MNDPRAALRDCVYDHSGATGSLRLLLLTLVNWTDLAAGYASPKVDTLRRAMGINRRNVQQAIFRAKDKRLLRVEPGTGRGNPSRYYVMCGDPRLHERASQSTPIAGGKGRPWEAERASLRSGKGVDAVLSYPALGIRSLGDGPLSGDEPGRPHTPVHDGRHGPSCVVCAPLFAVAGEPPA